MFIDAPDSANKGASFTVRVSGIPSGASKVRLEKDGFLGEAREVSGEWKSFTVSHNFPGRISLRAVAVDKFGDGLDSASTSITIKDPAFDNATDAEPDSPVRVLARQAVAGQPWQIIIANVAAAESMVLEFFGANGGICRFFPRGRNEMSATLTPHEPGPQVVSVTLRDKQINTIGRTKFFPFAVLPAGQNQAGMDAGAPAESLAAAPPANTALGPGRKPPYMLPHDSFAGGPAPVQASAQTGPASAAAPSSYPSSTRLEDIQRDMQARTDALLNRLKRD